MLRFAVIGYGYWGPNLVRNCYEVAGSTVSWVCDVNSDRLAGVSKRYPGIRTTADYREAINDPETDVIVIATPVALHFEIAWAALQAGKHLLVEKPVTQSADQARRLMEEADKRGLTMAVDHTFIHTGAIQKIRELMVSGELGDPHYYDSIRVNLGLFQHDVNVLWDLAVHDLSILNYLLDDDPVEVSATGANLLKGMPESVAYLTVRFDSGAIAHINVNWLAPVKVRQTLIGCSERMVVYDDLEPSEKIKVYDSGVTLTQNGDQIHEMLVGYRSGDMWAPKLSTKEGLRSQIENVIESVSSGGTPLTSAEMGLRVVELLEAADQSLAANGGPIKVAF